MELVVVQDKVEHVTSDKLVREGVELDVVVLERAAV